MTEKKKNGSGGKTRREFLKDAGLLVGGTAVGSTVLLAACSSAETETVTNTVTNTVTTTAGGGTATVTQTETQSRFVDPIDQMEFDTLAELQAHFEAAHPAGEGVPGLITLDVNNQTYNVTVDNEDTLAWILREKCLLPGTKIGCNRGECGTCTVLLDGRPVYACLVLAIEATEMKIETVEGLGTPVNLSALQQKFVDTHAVQCGFCTPGMLLAATALLRNNPNPTRDEAKMAVSGNICVCGAMIRIIQAITEAGGA
jgi:aerobic-type carbon monoxide dehydrogenase small subunit (CoxS/CutS family)